MKRYGNLYDKITDMDNLRVAFYKAAQGKHYQDKVKIVEENCDEYLMRLKEMLENGTYHTSQYATKQKSGKFIFYRFTRTGLRTMRS